MLSSRTAPFVVAAFTLTGCGGSLSGEVDGDGAPTFFSSALGQAEVGGTDFALSVYSSLPNTCELAAEFLNQIAEPKVGDQGDAEDLFDGVGTFLQERLPEDYWVMVTSVQGSDIDNADGETVKLDDQDDDDFSISVIVCHNTDKPDLDDHSIDFKSDCFGAVDGEVDLAFEKKERFALKGNLELEDTNDDDAGDVDVDASASFCDTFSDALSGYIDTCDDGEENCGLGFNIFFAALAGESTTKPEPPEPECPDSCEFGCDGECDEPSLCDDGTDTEDCG